MEGLEKGTYELLEQTLKNTHTELTETKTKLRRVETEKYDMSLEILQLKLQINLDSGNKRQPDTNNSHLAELTKSHEKYKQLYEQNNADFLSIRASLERVRKEKEQLQALSDNLLLEVEMVKEDKRGLEEQYTKALDKSKQNY